MLGSENSNTWIQRRARMSLTDTDRATSVHPGGRRAAPRLGHGRAHARPPRRRAAAPPARRGGVGRGARRDDRRSGRADGEGRAEGDLPLGLAGRSRREPLGQHVSRPEPLPGEQRSRAREADQQRAAARRPDRARRGRRLDPLARADRRRRRGRLRWAAERVRAHEVVHRGGRGRRALRGPALVREEVRPPRRQGARADGAARPHARRRPPGRRRRRRADARRRPHRRALGAKLLTSDIDETRRRVLHRRAHARGLLPRPRRHRRRDRPRRSPTRRTPI